MKNTIQLPSIDNPYIALGVEDADEMYVKSELAFVIQKTMEMNNWTQQKAADIMGVPQSRLSKILKGEFRNISQYKLLNCLINAGSTITIKVNTPAKKMADSN